MRFESGSSLTEEDTINLRTLAGSEAAQNDNAVVKSTSVGSRICPIISLSYYSGFGGIVRRIDRFAPC